MSGCLQESSKKLGRVTELLAGESRERTGGFEAKFCGNHPTRDVGEEHRDERPVSVARDDLPRVRSQVMEPPPKGPLRDAESRSRVRKPLCGQKLRERGLFQKALYVLDFQTGFPRHQSPPTGQEWPTITLCNASLSSCTITAFVTELTPTGGDTAKARWSAF